MAVRPGECALGCGLRGRKWMSGKSGWLACQKWMYGTSKVDVWHVTSGCLERQVWPRDLEDARSDAGFEVKSGCLAKADVWPKWMFDTLQKWMSGMSKVNVGRCGRAIWRTRARTRGSRSSLLRRWSTYPQTLNPRPQTPNPKSQTLNPGGHAPPSAHLRP